MAMAHRLIWPGWRSPTCSWTACRTSAHTTASDALCWAGVPLITQRGNAFPGHVAASLLHAIGLPQLVTENEEDFETLAVKLARDMELLNSIRRR